MLDSKGNNRPESETTDASGEAKFKIKSGTYKVKLDSVPSDYVLPTSVYNFTDNAAIITVEKKDLGPLYSVKLVDQNGDVVIGAGVQMCSDKCFTLRDMNDTGTYSLNKAVADYKAQINSLPEGYSFKAGTDASTKYEFLAIDGGFYVEIEVVKD